MANPFYLDKKWRRKREIVLRRDGYKCRECSRYGRNKNASAVHHIIPLEWCLVNDKRLALDSRNLLSLCTDCHNAMHNRDADALTAKGLQWADRIYRGELPEGWEQSSARLEG